MFEIDKEGVVKILKKKERKKKRTCII